MAHDVAGLIRLLQEAHSTEVGGLEGLDAFNPGFASFEASEIVAEYKSSCENQVRAVSMLLESMGAKQSSAKSFVNVVFGKANDWMNATQGAESRNTMLFVRYYGGAHLKAGLYQAIATYANVLHDPEVENLSATLRNQEQDFAAKLFPFIDELASYADDDAGAPPVSPGFQL